MSRLASMAFGAALVLTHAYGQAQTPQPAKPVNSNRQANPANPRNPGGNNSGYNGSQTGVTDAAATVGAAADNNSQSSGSNPAASKGNTTSGAYNGSQTGVTSAAGTIAAAPPSAGRIPAGTGPNFTGTWSLNIGKSSWGKKAKPQSVVVNVEQSHPELKYSGTTTDTDGSQTTFDLDAAIDARQHSVKTSYGPGKITLKRLNAYTVASDFHSDDGKFTESATTAVSRDGRTLTRRMRTKGPDGDASWTEVYDRK